MRVHRAQLIRPVELLNRLSPHVRATLGNDSQVSAPHTGAGPSPVWNASFNFFGGDVDRILRVTVIDNNLMRDDIIGEAEIDVNELGSFVGEREYMLYYRGTPAGSVWVSSGAAGLPGGYTETLTQAYPAHISSTGYLPPLTATTYTAPLTTTTYEAPLTTTTFAAPLTTTTFAAPLTTSTYVAPLTSTVLPAVTTEYVPSYPSATYLPSYSTPLRASYSASYAAPYVPSYHSSYAPIYTGRRSIAHSTVLPTRRSISYSTAALPRRSVTYTSPIETTYLPTTYTSTPYTSSYYPSYSTHLESSYLAPAVSSLRRSYAHGGYPSSYIDLAPTTTYIEPTTTFVDPLPRVTPLRRSVRYSSLATEPLRTYSSALPVTTLVSDSYPRSLGYSSTYTTSGLPYSYSSTIDPLPLAPLRRSVRYSSHAGVAYPETTYTSIPRTNYFPSTRYVDSVPRVSLGGSSIRVL